MTLPWIIVIGLVILTFILLYVIGNLLKKVERYEDIVFEQSTYIKGASEAIAKSRERLNEIDQKGSFESDDEVGWFFQNLKELQELLDTFNIQGIYGKKEE